MSMRGLVDYYATRCENAKGKTCYCRCRGEFHGIAHSEQWRAEMTARLDAQNEQRRELKVPLVGG